MFYYYNSSGVVKMISEEEIESDLNVVELPTEDLSGKLAQIVRGELVLEDNPSILAETERANLGELKAGLRERAANGTLTLADVSALIRNFL